METPNPLRTLRIISAAMLGAALLFLTLTLVLRPGMLQNSAGGLEIVAYLACGWAALSLPLASVFRAARWPSTTPEQDPAYWPKRSAAHLVSMGLLEGAALFCCVTLMISKPWWPLFAMLVPLGGMLAWFPRDE
jgi:hypothetical protein